MKFPIIIYVLSAIWIVREANGWSLQNTQISLLQQHRLLPLLPIVSQSSSPNFYYDNSIIHSHLRNNNNNNNMRLYGISEWRDMIIDYPGTGDDRRLGKESGALPKEICILPFPYEEALLQGETKQLRLYEDRFIQLFDTSIQQHGGIVAMGLIASSGIIQTVPIAEIEDYNRQLEKDGFGIFVTIRVVGRAKLLDIVQQSPFIIAVCTEITDTVPPNLDLPCLLASNIETSMIQLSSMEHRLEMAKQSGDIIGDTKSILSKENATTAGDPNDFDLVMQHRLRLAKLEDTYYDETNDDDDDEDDDDDDEDVAEAKDKNEGVYIDRRKRFRRAYDVALATDTQGYQVFATLGNESKPSLVDRTVPELVALSWAAFCTELLPEIDAAVRIQALDCDNIFTRLKLASALMRQKKALLRARMEKAGLSVSAEDESNSEGGGTTTDS